MSLTTDTDYGPVMRGRSSPFRKAPLGTPNTSEPGAETPPGSRRRRYAKRVVVTVAVLVALVVLTGVGLVLYTSALIERQEVTGLQSSRPMNILVTGTDSRAGMTREQQLELTTGSEGGDLTDTIFVLQAGGGEVAMLAFPRDLWVTRCDGSEGRINAAVSIGGPGCLVETITDLSGIEISHHIEVNFLGFRDIVDAVDGVDVCLDAPIVDRDAGLDLPAGCQTLDGVDALGYVRVRKIDNDLKRIERQQRFVKALAQKVVSSEVLTSPQRVFNTATTMARAVTADRGLGAVDLVRTAWALRGVAEGLDAAYTVPATDAILGGASVLQIEEDAARTLFNQFSDGDLLTSASETSSQPDPAEIAVTVLNGARTEGLAGRVAEQLRSQGFVVTRIGNVEAQTQTSIHYPTGSEAAARVLRDVSGRPAELLEDSTVEEVTLLLGQDAAGDSAP